MDKIGKILNDKYKTAKIVEIGSNEETEDLKYFRIVFSLDE